MIPHFIGLIEEAFNLTLYQYATCVPQFDHPGIWVFPLSSGENISQALASAKISGRPPTMSYSQTERAAV
jgi:hypothetical protein